VMIKMNKMNKTINIYFGEKDSDLYQWACSVPKGLFSYYVRESIRAHLNNVTDYKLPHFEQIETGNRKRKRIVKPISINNPEDEKILNYVLSIKNNLRSFEIKQILKKYLLLSKLDFNEVNFCKENYKNTEKFISSKSSVDKQDKIAKMIKSSISRSRVK